MSSSVRQTPWRPKTDETAPLMVSKSTKAAKVMKTIVRWTLQLALVGFAIAAFAIAIDSQRTQIQTINSVAPLVGHHNVQLVPDQGISIMPGTALGTVSIKNEGILTASTLAGSGIAITTGQHPVFSNTGVLNVTVGVGLNKTGTQNPVLSNTGLLNLTVTAGLSTTGGQSPVVSNTGLLSLTVGSGLNYTGGQNVVLVNEGTLSVTPGIGMEDSGSAQNPELDHILTKQARTLAFGHPDSPSITYEHTFSALNSSNGLAVLASTVLTEYVPGSGGAYGQGDVNNTLWAIPSVGLYQLNILCTYTAYNVQDSSVLAMSVTLGGTNDTVVTGQLVVPTITKGYPASTVVAAHQDAITVASLINVQPSSVFTVGMPLHIYFVYTNNGNQTDFDAQCGGTCNVVNPACTIQVAKIF